MKKYYVIYSILGATFIIAMVTIVLNPGYIHLRRGSAVSASPTPQGDIALLVIGCIVVLAIVARIIYLIYKYTRKLLLKIQGKTDDKDYKGDSSELYTEKQTSQNISDYYISITRGKLDDDK